MKQNFPYGPVFIMLGASLWAIDALFRTQLTFSFSSTFIIFFEHLLGFFILSPFFIKSLNEYKKLNTKAWVIAISMTIVSSVAGTLLFTEALNRSFAFGDFATPVLLQKLQPVFVVILSSIFLKEKITPRFLILALIALLGSYLLSFGTSPISLNFAGKEIIVLLAIGAAFAWGSGTIMSKFLLTKLSHKAATALRFLLAIPISASAVFILGESFDFGTLDINAIWRFILIAGITGGAGAMLLYYFGLKSTQAKISTFAELAFPITSLIIAITPLNPYGEAQTLSLANLLGVIILFVSVSLISFKKPTIK
ncbi:DMT family transporter [Candidatus Dojkabacteria bacterium]|uniref:DMT family transporter n=1 Tax=Candidatus Dojkabacteria bacterium TaxID=2099670 RepID=A0A955RKA4_9BACT|nr:DMT family transporter [Candidatus Dojkabacteria bacterium]